MNFFDKQIDGELFVRETLALSARKYLRLKYICVIFGVLNIMLLLVLLTATYVRVSESESKLKERVDNELGSLKIMLSLRINDALSDLFFLSDVIDHEFSFGNADIRKSLALVLHSYMRNTDQYDQARFLGSHGREQVRINRVVGSFPEEVPPEGLQDKAGRRYFREAMDMNTNVAYISSLDLNEEHGLVEVPYKLVIRFATPIYYQGIIEGVLVLNFLGSELLADSVHILKQDGDFSGDEYFLLNNEGEPLAYLKWEDGAICSNLLGPDASTAFDKTFGAIGGNVFDYNDGVYSNDQIVFAKDTILVDSTASRSSHKFDLIKKNVLAQEELYDGDLVLFSVTSGVGFKDGFIAFVRKNLITVLGTELLFILIALFYSTTMVRDDVLEDAIKEAAAYDPLTGVYNRRFGVLFLQHEFKKIRRSGDKLTIFEIDVNNLKKINDTLGHSAGDELLTLVSERFKSELREYDIVCRLGGDEFMVAFAGMDLELAAGVMERIRSGLEEDNRQNFLGIGVNFAYGGAEYNGAEYESFEELLSEADKRMYEDKKRRKQGREV